MFLKRDVDFKLLFLIIIVVLAIVGVTVLYQTSFGDILGKYSNLKNKYEGTAVNLTQKIEELNACLRDKYNLTMEIENTQSYQQKAQEEYNKIYKSTESQLQNTAATLEGTQRDLADAQRSLDAKQQELTEVRSELSDVKTEKQRIETKYERLKDDVDECKSSSDKAACVSSINTN